MSMDLYSTGIPWQNKNKDPKYINFNSEVVVRKGHEGWVINSKIDNYSQDQTYFDYILTTYKYEENQWNVKNKKWWSDQWTMGGTNGIYKVTRDQVDIYVANVHNDKLIIKTPKESWWNGDGWMSTTGTSKIVRKNKTETKIWSGVWVEESVNREDSWIFQDIELYIGEKKNSLMFCDGEENACFNTFQSSNKANKFNQQDADSWSKILSPHRTYDNDVLRTMLKDTVKPIIEKIKVSRGTWLDLETVCNLKDTRNLNDSQKKQLSMYCTNGKKA